LKNPKLWEKIVIGDKKMGHPVWPRNKMLKFPLQSKIKIKSHMTELKAKIMLICFSDVNRIVHYEFIPPQQNI
jgi:hypothetical protein